jgi:hypothetical protein
VWGIDATDGCAALWWCRAKGTAAARKSAAAAETQMAGLLKKERGDEVRAGEFQERVARV